MVLVREKMELAGAAPDGGTRAFLEDELLKVRGARFFTQK